MEDTKNVQTHDSKATSMEELGEHFQQCIQAVEQLELERNNLICELTQLREPALEEIRKAHEEILAAYQLQTTVELERDSLKEEILRVKWKLFNVTRECVACQYQLETRRSELAQFAVYENELECRVKHLSEELSQLRQNCTKQKEQFMQHLEASQNQRDSCFLQENRRLSVEFESFLLESRQSLEAQYEPQLVRLLERREASAMALHQTQRELKGLREAMRVLQGETIRLQIQNRSLEEQILMIKCKRDEEVLHFREKVEELEDQIRELKNRVQLQQRKKKEMEELRASLTHELYVYKGCLEIYGELCHDGTKAVNVEN
ncbi:syncoilin [Rhinatrema bivittatum]|uniref:syncoilin n=1 Tax=Rhinatrema bivittatum TaxID=194408 RepID=UPI00112DA111|nr:syncoilin [Rhinatrema bivittatum]